MAHRGRKIELRQLQLGIIFSREQRRLVQQPLLKKASSRFVVELHQAATQTKPLNIGSTDRPIQVEHFRYTAEVGHKVQHYHFVLVPTDPQSAAQLLNEDPAAVRRAHEHDEVHIGHVDAFVEQVHRGDDVIFSGARIHVTRQIGNAVPCSLAEAMAKPANSWQFQGFQDAKTVLIEQILTTLEKRVSGIPKAKRLLLNILRRVKVFKIARTVVGLVITAKTGIPVASISDLGDALVDRAVEKPAEAVAGVESLGECVSAPEAKTLPKEMEGFREEFADLLKEAGITRLVVLLDDLDRCLPATAIETLEAIKLFLFAPGAVFVIAADEGMIEYAVKKHFPDLPTTASPSSYARNYLEKLVQVPFRIPAMGLAETRVYIALLMLEARLTAENAAFNVVRDVAREALRKPWEREVFDRAHLRDKLGNSTWPGPLEEALTLSDQLAPMLADQTKGNPRQVKRFLNALLLRQNIAAARGLHDEIKTTALAKVMLAERFLPELYEQLAVEAAKSDDGTAPKLLELEKKEKGASSDERVKPTAVESVKKEEASIAWALLEPSLADEDLRPYILVTRDQRNPFSVSTSKNAALISLFLVRLPR